jgi:outer membrane biogenesis lipoprotein LolB
MRNILLIVSAALLLSACGVKGDPQAPSAVRSDQQQQQQQQQQ